jgi:diguanylate cyclase (GGDEF)-like protein
MHTAPKIILLKDESGTPEHFSALLRAFSVGNAFIGIYDDSDYLRYANEAFLRAFCLTEGEVATFASIVRDAAHNKRGARIEASDPEAFIEDAQMRRRILAQAPRQRTFPVDFVDDRWFWCTETLLPDGWIVLTGADITKLKEEELLLSAERDHALILSGVDELTGVPNRRSALSRLDSMLDTALSEQTPLCVALLDLDHFKSINDTFGHETGDTALRQFAQHCLGSLGNPSHVGRLGGEEFVLLFPNVSCDDVKAALEVMLLTMMPVSSRLPAHVRITLTFSAGIAQAEPGDSRDDLLARADKALYKAKQNGRSRVEIFGALCAERPRDT